MQETYRHPVDPKSLRFVRKHGPPGNGYGLVMGMGRDDYEGEEFAHIRNVQNLESAKALAIELTEMRGYPIVTGPGIDEDSSLKTKRRWFDHKQVGLFKSTRTSFPNTKKGELS